MQPILLSWHGFQLASLGIFLILAWLAYSFLFWRHLRNQGIEEERIFDLIFYSTLSGFIFSRLWFVIVNRELFIDSWLKVFAIWVQPGLTFYGGLVGGVVMMFFISKKHKIRLGYILDALGLTMPLTLAIGSIGSLLDGTVVGKLSDSSLALFYVGHAGRRHPVQIYDLGIILFIWLICVLIQKRAAKNGWPYGFTGLTFFLFFSLAEFIIEFFKESGVYFSYLNLNQWILIAIFAESMGAIYVIGGGRNRVKYFWNRIRDKITKGGRSLYARLSKRSFR